MHGIDVAVKRWSLFEAIPGARALDLHEQHEKRPAWAYPPGQLFGISSPVIRVECTKAGLFVNGIELMMRFVRQYIGFNNRRVEAVI